jgi:hypothetical protein
MDQDREAPVFIAPECHAAGCHRNGDQYTMVKCRVCDNWFCAEHLDTHDTVRRVSMVDTGMPGLTYYLGLCLDCREKLSRRRRPVDSSWLR